MKYIMYLWCIVFAVIAAIMHFKEMWIPFSVTMVGCSSSYGLAKIIDLLDGKSEA